MKTVRLFVYKQDNETFAYLLDWFRQFGAETEHQVFDIYEGSGKWHEFTVKSLTGATNRDITRLARVPHDTLGFVVDPGEVPAARAEVMVSSWDFVNGDGQPVPVSKPGYYSLPKAITDILDGVLLVNGEVVNGGGTDRPFLEWCKRQTSMPASNSSAPPAGEKSTETTDDLVIPVG